MYIFYLIGLLALLSGCIDSQKVIKSNDRAYKYKMASQWFQQGKYIHAVPVIEDLMVIYKGTDTAPKLYFMLAESYYLNKEYTVAAYHYKTYKDLYGKTPNAEIATYKLADCYAKQVAPIELDQVDTKKAIDYFKVFISEYPYSDKNNEALKQIEQLKRNLEVKALMSADLYYKTQNYRAASYTYKNVINQFPEIKEFEEIYYKIVVSNYNFAKKSILKKQPERFETSINEAQSFLSRFQKSKHRKEVSEIIENSNVELLRSSLKFAQTTYPVEDRPIYFVEAISAYQSFEKEIKDKPNFLNSYLDDCYYGILNSSYIIVDQTKEQTLKEKHFTLFLENYNKYKYSYTKDSKAAKQADELYKKIHKLVNL
jgi:outer membrane protein assembly factor BamD